MNINEAYYTGNDFPKEYKGKIGTLTIGICSKVQVHARLTTCLLHYQTMHEKLFDGDFGQRAFVDFLMGKSHIDQARSTLLTHWHKKANKGDILVMLDSDHVFTPNDIKTMVDRVRQDDCYVSGLIYSNPQGRPTTAPFSWEDLLSGRDDSVRFMATGAMCVKKATLDHLYRDFGNVFYNGEWITPFFQATPVKLISDKDREQFQVDKDDSVWLGEDYCFCHHVRRVLGDRVIKASVSNSFGHEVYQMLKFYPEKEINMLKDDPDIVYLLGKAQVIGTDDDGKPIEHYPRLDPNSNSLGGSEQAVVNLCKEWSKMGKKVVVYGTIKDNGVVVETDEGCPPIEFRDIDKMVLDRGWRNLIAWRGFGISFLLQHAIKSENLTIDLHDCTDANLINHVLPLAKRIWFKSKFHRELYQGIPEEKCFICSNGVISGEIAMSGEMPSKRNEQGVFYCSSYSRGLPLLMEFWDDVKKALGKGGRLTICYGWHPSEQQLQKRFRKWAKSRPEVKEIGRVDRDKLAQIRAENKFHFYPCLQLTSEIDCLAVRESARVGNTVVMPDAGVFKYRTGFHFKNKQDLLKIFRGKGGDCYSKGEDVVDSWADVAKQTKEHFF